jgi:Flp pilus assembly protein TadB
VRAIVAAVAALGLLLIYEGLTFRDQRSPVGLVERLNRIAAEAGFVRMTGGGLLAFSLALAGFSLLLVAGLTGSFIVALVFALGASLVPISIARSRRIKRRRRFREAWPDAIAGLISGVRAVF